MISIQLQMRGMPTPRARVGKYGGYYKDSYIQYKKALRMYFKQFKGYDATKVLDMDCTFVFKPSKSVKRNKFPKCPPYDGDNLVKGILDAGNGILYADDMQFNKISVRKMYGEQDMIFINIKEII